MTWRLCHGLCVSCRSLGVLQGNLTYTPRAILFDLCGSLGGITKTFSVCVLSLYQLLQHTALIWLPCFAPLLKRPLSPTGVNTAGEHAPEAEAVPITTWQGPVEVTRSARIPVSAFAEQLLSEPEHELESMPSAPISSACAHTFCGRNNNTNACFLLTPPDRHMCA